VGKKFLFELAVEEMRECGFEEFYFNAHHLSHIAFPLFRKYGEVLFERELLGVGGTIISFLSHLTPGEWVLFRNCDVWLANSFYRDLLSFLEEKWVGCMAVAKRKGGRVAVSGGMVVGLAEEETGWDFVGVSLWKKMGYERSGRGEFSSFLEKRLEIGDVGAFEVDFEWLDAGTFEGYYRVNEVLAEGEEWFTSFPFGSGRGKNSVVLFPNFGEFYENGVFLRSRRLFGKDGRMR
jgi:NDP-sugar pyrophosphorylase family protein